MSKMEFIIPTVSSLCCEPSPLSLFFSSHLHISLQASYRSRNGSQKPQGHLTDPASVTPTDGASQILLKCMSPVNPYPGRRAVSCHRTPRRRNPCTVAVPLAEPHSPHLLHGGPAPLSEDGSVGASAGIVLLRTVWRWFITCGLESEVCARHMGFFGDPQATVGSC